MQWNFWNMYCIFKLFSMSFKWLPVIQFWELMSKNEISRTISCIYFMKIWVDLGFESSEVSLIWAFDYTAKYGGPESARSKRMASEVNWGHWGYHQGQILFLTSFPICRTLEQPPVLHTLAVMDRRSHLVSSRKIISVSACEIPNFANFWAIWTIWASNQSWKYSEFKFDMKKYNLLWKIRCTSEFFIFCIGKVYCITYQKKIFMSRCSMMPKKKS